MSLTSRLYDEMQIHLTNRLDNGDFPTTQQLQQVAFGKDYNPDSRIQRDTIYGIIMRGRDNAILGFEEYFKSKECESELTQIEYYSGEAVHEQEATEDYAEFYDKLNIKYFGENTSMIRKDLPTFLLLAVIWGKKIKEFSRNGNNLVIANFGPNSGWTRPSFWRWAVRERNLYIRTANIITRQLRRGIGTRIALESAIPLNEAVEHSTYLQQVLEDHSKQP